MKYQLAGCLVLLGLSCVAQAADPLDRHQLNSLTQEDLRAREIIRRADRVRAPERPFRYTLTLLEHKEGRDVTENQQVLDISMRFYKPSEQVEKEMRVHWCALSPRYATKVKPCSPIWTRCGITLQTCGVRSRFPASNAWWGRFPTVTWLPQTLITPISPGWLVKRPVARRSATNFRYSAVGPMSPIQRSVTGWKRHRFP